MRSWVVPVLLSGCNQIWGLDETRTDVDRTSDEDADGKPNVDDNCPGVINDSQSDADNDDAGDACDPHPGLHDRLLDAYYFNRPMTDVNEWTATNLVFQTGFLEQPLVDVVERVFALQTRDVQQVAVEVGLSLTNFGSFQANKTGIYIDGPTGHRCYFQRINSTQTRLWVQPLGSAAEGPTLALPLAVGAPLRLVARLDRASQTVDCILGAAKASTVAPAASPPGPIGLFEEADAVQFAYVVVWGVD